eukprot:RCo023679
MNAVKGSVRFFVPFWCRVSNCFYPSSFSGKESLCVGMWLPFEDWGAVGMESTPWERMVCVCVLFVQFQYGISQSEFDCVGARLGGHLNPLVGRPNSLSLPFAVSQ